MAKKKYFTEAEKAKIMGKVKQQNPNLTIDRLRMLQYYELISRIAKDQGGECISTRYINQSTEMNFKCGKGHEFTALPVNIIHGHWCFTCGYEKRSSNSKIVMIERLKTIALMHGGQICFGKHEYKDSLKPVKFRCKLGHEWVTRPTVVMQGGWCPKCKNTTIAAHRRVSGRQHLNDVLAKKKWTLIGPEYTRLKDSYSFSCEKGHVFKATANNLVQFPLKTCPVCKKSPVRKKQKGR